MLDCILEHGHHTMSLVLEGVVKVLNPRAPFQNFLYRSGHITSYIIISKLQLLHIEKNGNDNGSRTTRGIHVTHTSSG
jgi:hypothetical protein